MAPKRERLTLGQTVRQRRKQLNLTQAQAAELAGIVRRTWAEIELGHRHGNSETLASMEHVLGIPTGSLAALETNPEDDELRAIQRELVGMVRQLTTREELEQARLDMVRRQFEAVKRRLDAYGDSAPEESA
jgi:transcriptional regulator with XRE-family HTH domain